MSGMPWSESKFSQRLDAALEAAGLTQKKFASDIGEKEGTLSGWKERNEPSYDDVLKLAKGLAVRPAWLIFDDGFEPMDDEEKELLTIYRKLEVPERASLRGLMLVLTTQRALTKKPGKRTPPAVELIEETQGVSRSPADQELFSTLPELSAVQRSEAGLLEHLSVLPIGTKAWIACEAAAIQLRRLIAALQSSQRAAQKKDSSAKKKAASQASAKSRQDRAPSDRPLPFPPE